MKVGSGFGKKSSFKCQGSWCDEDVVSRGQPGWQVNVPTLCRMNQGTFNDSKEQGLGFTSALKNAC